MYDQQPRPNRFIRIWYPANRFGGFLLLVYGLVVLATAVLLSLFFAIHLQGIYYEIYSYFMVAILISGAVLILLLSWHHARMLEIELEQNDGC